MLNHATPLSCLVNNDGDNYKNITFAYIFFQGMAFQDVKCYYWSLWQTEMVSAVGFKRIIARLALALIKKKIASYIYLLGPSTITTLQWSTLTIIIIKTKYYCL